MEFLEAVLVAWAARHGATIGFSGPALPLERSGFPGTLETEPSR